MSRKLALKRLTKSDLTLFRWHFENNNAGNQKAINLNRDVFVDVLFPALPVEAQARGGKLPLDLYVYGPGLAREINLQRKIIKGGQYKNWRLNGEFIEDPLGEPARFNALVEGDFALFEFVGASIPQGAKLCLIDLATSGALHAACDNFLGPRRMAALRDTELDLLLQKAGVDDLFPISGSALESALEDAALGGLEGTRRLEPRTATRKLTREELRQARDRAERNGELGEEFINDYFTRHRANGVIEHFEWVSEVSATAPFDFRLTRSGTAVVLDVKATTGPFANRVHVSLNELLHMRDSDAEYHLYRIYNMDGSTARLRISGPMRSFAEQVVPLLEALPAGVTAEDISINPERLSFGPEIALQLSDEEE